MVRQYSDNDIDAVMQIWLDTNIQAHHFIPSDYWRTNCNMVREMLPHAEIYVHEDDCTKQIDGFIGLNDDYIEGVFVKETMQSKGIGKQLLNHAKEFRLKLKLLYILISSLPLLYTLFISCPDNIHKSSFMNVYSSYSSESVNITSIS